MEEKRKEFGIIKENGSLIICEPSTFDSGQYSIIESTFDVDGCVILDNRTQERVKGIVLSEVEAKLLMNALNNYFSTAGNEDVSAEKKTERKANIFDGFLGYVAD